MQNERRDERVQNTHTQSHTHTHTRTHTMMKHKSQIRGVSSCE